MSKGNSGLFHGTLGTTRVNSSLNNTSYSDRGVEIPEHIKQILSKLQNKGDIISGNKDSFSIKDVSVMSKETGVEFAKVSIGNKTYLIRGDKNGAVVPEKLMKKMTKNGGILDFHSHPHDNDCIPSRADREMIKSLKSKTGQSTSRIVTPNGRTVTFNEHGVISTGTVPNLIDESLKQAYLDLWR
ncbi:MAG: hypothetical protein Q4B67_00680 [Eubacteriales bacterium]|nr:hypothetical protein [Eubacteriales bacterium]